MSRIIKIYQEEATSILDVDGIFPSNAFQPISQNIIDQMQKDGGNALGITADRGPLMSRLGTMISGPALLTIFQS
jgi:hypothetical protein